jgi:hypothetical protein
VILKQTKCDVAVIFMFREISPLKPHKSVQELHRASLHFTLKWGECFTEIGFINIQNKEPLKYIPETIN